MPTKDITEDDIPDDVENFEEVKERIKELGDVNKQLKITATKTKLLNNRKKELNKFILPCLRKKEIKKCNLPSGTLQIKATKRKIPPKKATIKERYEAFFRERALDRDFKEGNAKEKAEIFYKYIYEETVEYVEGHNLTFTLDRQIQKQLNELSLTDLASDDEEDE
jgi:hypothetical protein